MHASSSISGGRFVDDGIFFSSFSWNKKKEKENSLKIFFLEKESRAGRPNKKEVERLESGRRGAVSKYKMAGTELPHGPNLELSGCLRRLVSPLARLLLWWAALDNHSPCKC